MDKHWFDYFILNFIKLLLDSSKSFFKSYGDIQNFRESKKSMTQYYLLKISIQFFGEYFIYSIRNLKCKACPIIS